LIKLSTNAILHELAYISDSLQTEALMSNKMFDINDFIDEANSFLETQVLNEEEYNKITDRLKIEILDIEQFVKKNDIKCVSDPRAFIRDGIPSPEGLVSNDIFGISNEERAGIFGYIDLHGWFIDPSCYKAWIRVDNKVRNIVHGIGKYKVNSQGEIVEDNVNGKTGIKFLKDNLDKIKFKSNDSVRRDLKVTYLNKNKDKMFIKKYVVIPPYYRDKNSGSGRTIGLGGINKLYNNLIIGTNALESTQDFMFDASDSMNARVQETILCIYDWFCGNTNKNINVESGTGLSSKLGLIRRANMSKTADFASRLVLSEANLKAERPEDMMVTFDKSAIPLSATIAGFRDFITFQVRRFFDNEFMGTERYPVLDSKGNMSYVVPQDPFIEFSDERIKHEMERFLHGYNNRFVPIEVPVEGTSEKYYMVFKGRNITPLQAQEDKSNPLKQRRLTWCDIFYIAAVEATKNKNILVTRFPIDKYSNQLTTGIVVSSTKKTEQIEIEGVQYKYYPKIREKDIGIDTSNLFVDTMQISNSYLKGLCADEIQSQAI